MEELDRLLDLANDIEANPAKYAHACTGKKLATLFYEPSTRTRLSFEAAMLNLGGSVLGFSSADSSSAAKGESVADTIRGYLCYADICAMRHPKEGAPLVASLHSSIPVINAGDGGHQHPTQTLTDLLTIRSPEGPFGKPYHRPVRRSEVRTHGPLSDSCPCTLSKCFFCTDFAEELRIPIISVMMLLRANHCSFKEVVRLEDALPELDLLYMTRVQRERFFNEEDYVRMKDFYILDKAKMKLAVLICWFFILFPGSTRLPWKWTLIQELFTLSRLSTVYMCGWL